MSAAAHHPNVTTFTYCQLQTLRKTGGQITAHLTQKPRFVDEIKCIGCRQCEYNCPVYVPDEEQGGFAARKAIYIPFSNAIPQVAVMDVENCTLCGKCAKVCPTQAVDYFQKPKDFTLIAKTAVIATGFELTPLNDKQQYGYGEIENVVTALQMERLLAPHGPYNRVIRPSDGMEPDSIAFIQCAGSRDKSMGVSYCSRVCCMYAIKQAMLLSGAVPMADITIYYMDIRAFGKGYEQFFQNANAMGVEFIKGKVATIDPGENGSVKLQYEAQGAQGGVKTGEHDLVVLSLGMVAGWNPENACAVGYRKRCLHQNHTTQDCPHPLTDMEGVFVAGVAAGPQRHCGYHRGSGGRGHGGFPIILGSSPANWRLRRGPSGREYHDRRQQRKRSNPPAESGRLCLPLRRQHFRSCGGGRGPARMPKKFPGWSRCEMMCSCAPTRVRNSSWRTSKAARWIGWWWPPVLRISMKPPFETPSAGPGGNPYIYEHANIREQVSWVHHGDQATHKATRLRGGSRGQGRRTSAS